jgi:hypothetical protein
MVLHKRPNSETISGVLVARALQCAIVHSSQTHKHAPTSDMLLGAMNPHQQGQIRTA